MLRSTFKAVSAVSLRHLTVFGALSLVVCSADDVTYQNRTISAEKRLLRDLLGLYKWMGKMGRPVLNISHPTVVHFNLGLIQLDLDEKDKILTLSMWTRYHWYDEYLRWDPSEYNNLTTIHLDPDLLWKPDIKLYNTAVVDQESRDALAVVRPDGSVSWYPHTIFHSFCSIDVTNFPFDSQACTLWFGSWAHPSQEVDLQMDNPDGIDLSTFQSDHKESCAWNIVNVTGQRVPMPSEDEDPHFIVLTFELKMRRKLVFSTYMLTLPCVFLACLTLVVFWLPADRPDRTALAMSTFASFMLLLLILVETAPPTASSVPTLGVYYCFNMVIIMLAIILSSLVVNVSRGGKRQVPRWLSLITSCSRLCGRIKPSHHYGDYSKEKSSTDKFRMVSTYDVAAANTGRSNGFQAPHPNDPYGVTYASAVYDAVPRATLTCERETAPSPALTGVEAQIGEIAQVLRRLEHLFQRRRDSSEDFSNGEEWRRISVVLDRVFFFLFVAMIALSLAVLFPRAPR